MTEGNKTCTGPRFPRFLMNKVQDSCTGPRFPRIPRFFGTIRQDADKVPKNLGILGNLGPVHESCTLFIRILGNLGPVQVWWSLKSQNLHRPNIPKIPDEQSAGFMHRPKIPKNPKIFRNYQARPWQSSKKSWDSWESWACAWILHFVHRDSWESWACASFMKVLCQIMLFIRKNAFSLCFLMVNLRIGAEGLHFLLEFLKMENRILVLHYWVFF